MYTVAIHTISNPEKFWGAAKALKVPPRPQAPHRLPEHGRREGRLPLGGRGRCRPSSSSSSKVTSGVATNEYMAIEASSAMGLPKLKGTP